MRGEVILSARMQAVADLVSRRNTVCDVGCDHGYVSIYLVQQGIAPKVLAMDIHEGPLRRAEEHVRQAGLFPYITLRRSDGLLAYTAGEAKTLICAGMGGGLMRKILSREPEKTRSFQELILQPQSEVADFRKFLREQGYSIRQEDMILEEDKFYPMMRAVPDGRVQQGDAGLEDKYGPFLLANRHPVLLASMEREWENAKKLAETLQAAKGSKRAAERLFQLEKEMDDLREAFKICGRRL